eukprot:m.177406 g.177406  ORF g.177406 m.177406 type:complete len:274 (-) comp53371_c0_seq28:693-1514(-)
MTWLVFGVCAAIDFGLQIVFGVIAIVLRTERFYDLIGSLTFITLASVSLAWRGSDDDGGVSPRRIVQTSCVLLWAVRLGLFLVTRAALGEDRRFRKAKENPVLFMVYWLIQGVWVFLTLLPTLLLNTTAHNAGMSPLDYVGWGAFLFGFAFESIADNQKRFFSAVPENKGRFISVGLWSISRHPNVSANFFRVCFADTSPPSSLFSPISLMASTAVLWRDCTLVRALFACGHHVCEHAVDVLQHDLPSVRRISAHQGERHSTSGGLRRQEMGR